MTRRLNKKAKALMLGLGMTMAVGAANHVFAQQEVQMQDGQRNEIQNVSEIRKIPDEISRFDKEQQAEIERQIKEQKAREEEEKRQKTKYMDVEITFYTAAADEGSGTGITASGTYATAGRTVAMNGVPFGTRVIIDGEEYIVEDRGAMGYGVIDVFVNSKAEAYARGRQYKTVQVILP